MNLWIVSPKKKNSGMPTLAILQFLSQNWTISTPYGLNWGLTLKEKWGTCITCELDPLNQLESTAKKKKKKKKEKKKKEKKEERLNYP